MTWRMPAETAPHDRIWMAFPREGEVMGDSSAAREATYAAWVSVAHAIVPFEPVTMVVDPSELSRARQLLSDEVDIVEAPLDDFWMRDIGPTFVIDDETGELGRALAAGGRDAVMPLVGALMDRALSAGRIRAPSASQAAEWFVALLVGDMQVRRVNRVLAEPEPAEIEARAQAAFEAFLRLCAVG